MNGLRSYARDLDLPERLGEPSLRVPEGSELCELVNAHLLAAGAEPVRAARCEYARWKPGVSVTAVHAVALADGSSRLVTAKLYTGGKARTLGERLPDDEERAAHAHPLLPAAVVPGHDLVLATFPADRVLAGLAHLYDHRFTGRLIEATGAHPPRSIRRRRTALELLRFKPERRAVLRLDLRVRAHPAAELEQLVLGARALPPEVAARVLRARAALGPAGLDSFAPSLVAGDERRGLVVEEWIPGERPAASSELDLAAGRLLARLHALPATSSEAVGPTSARADEDALELLGRDPATAQLARGYSPTRSSARRTTCHGDFHREQIMRDARTGELALLDLDSLGTGDPLADLASWTAEALEQDEGFERADPQVGAAALYAGYRSGGGERVNVRELDAAVAEALLRRAAGCLRRLEAGALARARTLLELAREIAPARTVFA